MLTVRQRYRRTDRRTDGRTTYDSNTALALRASRGKNAFATEASPRTPLRAYSAPSGLLAGLQGRAGKGRKWREGKGRLKGEGGKGREGR